MKIIPTPYFAARQYIETVASTCTKKHKNRLIEIAKEKVLNGCSAAITIGAIKREIKKSNSKDEAA